MSRDEPTDAPLPAVARVLLSDYRDHRRMPAAAFARVEGRLARAPSHGLRVAVIAAAAAAITIAALVGLQSLTAQRGDTDAAHDLAGDVREGTQARELGPTEAGDGGARRIAEPPSASPATPPAVLTPAPGPTEAATTTADAIPPRRRAAPHDADALPPAADPTGRAGEASTLAAERALLARAQRALTDGDLGGARSIAAEHRRRFPAGLLAPELAAIDAVAHCRGGASDPGAIASVFAAAHPGSPLRTTVDEACAAR